MLTQFQFGGAGKSLQRSLSVATLRWALWGVFALFAIEAIRHPLHADEAYIGEYTYFLVRDGYVHSDFFKGELRQEERFVVYHYLFVTVGSVFIKLFGFHLWTLRAVSWLSFGAICLLLGVYSSRPLKSPQHKRILQTAYNGLCRGGKLQC